MLRVDQSPNSQCHDQGPNCLLFLKTSHWHLSHWRTAKTQVSQGNRSLTRALAARKHKGVDDSSDQNAIVYISALDKLLGQLGIYATWLSSIAYLQK